MTAMQIQNRSSGAVGVLTAELNLSANHANYAMAFVSEMASQRGFVGQIRQPCKPQDLANDLAKFVAASRDALPQGVRLGVPLEVTA
jgi:predicted TIM-barrel fold metal-dependent hydrolase